MRLRRNPLADSEDLAQKLYDSMPFPLTEIPLSEVNLSTADRGHPVVDEPERYRWFLVPKFPVNAFGLRLEDLMRDSGYPSHEKSRHDKIVDLLLAGPAWPAIVTADGVLIDGFHRVTANRTLGRRFMPVVVAVDSSSSDYWDETWLESAKMHDANPPFAGFSELVRHYYGQGLTVPQIVAKINERARRPVGASSVLDVLRRAGYHVPPERMEPPRRMNADEERRKLERLAATGDERAAGRLTAIQVRHGEACPLCHKLSHGDGPTCSVCGVAIVAGPSRCAGRPDPICMKCAFEGRAKGRMRNPQDKEIRRLERAVSADPSPTNVMLLARAYERLGKTPELWLVTAMVEGSPEPRSLWPTEAEAKHEAARLYAASLADGRDSPLEAYIEEDAEYPDETNTSPPVTRREVLDAWDSLDVDRVIARAKDYIRRSTREKWQWSYEVDGPLAVGRDRAPS